MINILLNGLRAGDKVAFKRLYEYYYPKLIGFSLRIVKSPELAADIVQDVFANLWDNRSSLPAEMNFNAYIYTLAKNRSINMIKQSVNHSRIAYEILVHTYSKYIASSEDFFSQKDYFEILLSQLPEQQSKVFQLCKLEGFSYNDAARELNISPGTISVHMVKAMKNIREILKVHKN
ncbi:MAG: hypothetical protein CRN43_17215 [Candidatus Nephrothrix sp. EaCA]|nr:MAG: hypothetical protein CRN43_17215 [Candidatus Nephrothrix sp. EaCA]